MIYGMACNPFQTSSRSRVTEHDGSSPERGRVWTSLFLLPDTASRNDVDSKEREK